MPPSWATVAGASWSSCTTSGFAPRCAVIGGREMDTAGDGFFAIFDAPASAVRCALEIVEEVGKLGLEVRAGVHVGEVEQIGRKVGGITVPIASRIMSIAGPARSSSPRRFETSRRVADWPSMTAGRASSKACRASGTFTRSAVLKQEQSSPASGHGQRTPRIRRASRRFPTYLAAPATAGGRSRCRSRDRPRHGGSARLETVADTSSGGGQGELDRHHRSCPQRDSLGETTVGTRPGGIAAGEGYAWVTNTGADSVSQLDIRPIESRRSTSGGAEGRRRGRGVGLGGQQQRTDGLAHQRRYGRVTQSIEVGNGPTAIAAVGSLLWVANATDSTVVSIDAQTATVGQPVGVGASPIALAADENGLWVASEDAALVTHLDPVTGRPLSTDPA